MNNLIIYISKYNIDLTDLLIKRKNGCWSSHRGSVLMNPTHTPEDSGWIPALP